MLAFKSPFLLYSTVTLAPYHLSLESISSAKMHSGFNFYPLLTGVTDQPSSNPLYLPDDLRPLGWRSSKTIACGVAVVATVHSSTTLLYVRDREWATRDVKLFIAFPLNCSFGSINVLLVLLSFALELVSLPPSMVVIPSSFSSSVIIIITGIIQSIFGI